jgi:hypothetical protein
MEKGDVLRIERSLLEVLRWLLLAIAILLFILLLKRIT